jgi:hypothetical protein
MLFYGKEINIFYIILLVIFILVVYILFSFYTQQKQTIALTTSSRPISSGSPVVPIPIQSGAKLERGAFAISLWINITSWVPPTTADASFNVLMLNNTNPDPSTTTTSSTTSLTNILTLYIDASCNLLISSTFFTPQPKTKFILFPTYQITSSILPINEPVSIILNYNGDDDFNEDENEYYTDSSGKKQPIYNTNTGFAYNRRALDVFVNGMLNNTIIMNTTLTGNSGSGNSYVSYNDASMNYITNNNIQLVVGGNNPDGDGGGPIGTISNVSFIRGGCTTEDAQSINNGGNSSSILDDLLSYKLRFSLLEDNKEVKMYET